MVQQAAAMSSNSYRYFILFMMMLTHMFNITVVAGRLIL